MSALQITWFVLIGFLLGGYAVLDGFDLGVGFWYLFAKKEEERRAFLRAIGPVWDGNEVWLLTGGGAIFAAFPPVYASVFSGFYLALLLLLSGLILRAAAIEFRGQVSSPAWRGFWVAAFAAGSALPALLFGVALGNLVRGIELDASGNYTGGFFALLNPYALLVGVTGLAMFATHGALYLELKTEGETRQTARGWAAAARRVYLVLFLPAAAWSLLGQQRGSVLLPLTASALALASIVGIGLLEKAGRTWQAFLLSSLSILALLVAAGATLFPALVPAANDPSLSLTVFNSSASQKTLTVMLAVALLGMPVVIGYTYFIYRTFAGPVGTDGEDHY
jgi:cytochrome d ubiquinol oxidase subunit II